MENRRLVESVLRSIHIQSETYVSVFRQVHLWLCALNIHPLTKIIILLESYLQAETICV